MTHDELLESTKSPTYMNSRTLEHPYMVIRAVLELHKPFDFKLGNNILTSCEGCGEPDYPCQTIQAIEKELN